MKRPAASPTREPFSDLHFRARPSDTKYDRDREIRRVLEDDAVRVVGVVGDAGCVDAIVVSGDVGDAGQPADYQIAQAWLTRLSSDA